MNKQSQTLYRDGAFLDDIWTQLSEGAVYSGEGLVLVPYQIALEFLEKGKDVPSDFGVQIDPCDDVEALEPYLDKISLIAIHFPSFADGRGFSSARLLRERLSFSGEIRASGHYILDQMPFLQRCGVDAFMISSDKVRAGLERGDWPEVTHYYQPVASDGSSAIASRPWLRRKPVDAERAVITTDGA